MRGTCAIGYRVTIFYMLLVPDLLFLLVSHRRALHQGGAPALLERCGYVTGLVHLVQQLHLTTTMSVQKIKKASGVSLFERNIRYSGDRIESSCFSRLLHFNDVISPVLSLIMLGTR